METKPADGNSLQYKIALFNNSNARILLIKALNDSQGSWWGSQHQQNSYTLLVSNLSLPQLCSTPAHELVYTHTHTDSEEVYTFSFLFSLRNHIGFTIILWLTKVWISYWKLVESDPPGPPIRQDAVINTYSFFQGKADWTPWKNPSASGELYWL